MRGYADLAGPQLLMSGDLPEVSEMFTAGSSRVSRVSTKQCQRSTATSPSLPALSSLAASLDADAVLTAFEMPRVDAEKY